MAPSYDLGTTIGSYVLEEFLGSGGQAEVYRASRKGAEGFERSFALRITTYSSPRSSRARERQQREAAICARLRHANIAVVYDMGYTERGHLWSAQQLVEGFDLLTLLRLHARLPLHLVTFIGTEILRGLGYAHRHRVIHRDVALSNVLVDQEGTVKLIDFGMGAFVGSSSMSGTFEAPEGARDGRSDLYALGMLLWELLAGGRPPTKLPADAEVIRPVLERLCAPDPRHRYRDADEAIAAIAALPTRLGTAEAMRLFLTSADEVPQDPGDDVVPSSPLPVRLPRRDPSLPVGQITPVESPHAHRPRPALIAGLIVFVAAITGAGVAAVTLSIGGRTKRGVAPIPASPLPVDAGVVDSGQPVAEIETAEKATLASGNRSVLLNAAPTPSEGEEHPYANGQRTVRESIEDGLANPRVQTHAGDASQQPTP